MSTPEEYRDYSGERIDNFMYREDDFQPTISGYLFGLMLAGISGFIMGIIIAVLWMKIA